MSNDLGFVNGKCTTVGTLRVPTAQRAVTRWDGEPVTVTVSTLDENGKPCVQTLTVLAGRTDPADEVAYDGFVGDLESVLRPAQGGVTAVTVPWGSVGFLTLPGAEPREELWGSPEPFVGVREDIEAEVVLYGQSFVLGKDHETITPATDKVTYRLVKPMEVDYLRRLLAEYLEVEGCELKACELLDDLGRYGDSRWTEPKKVEFKSFGRASSAWLDVE